MVPSSRKVLLTSTLVVAFLLLAPGLGLALDMVAEHHRRALELLRRGETEAAAKEWRAALELAPRSVAIRLNLGLTLIKLGRPKEAEAVLAEAARLEPQRLRTHIYLARAYRLQGKFSLARAELALAQSLEPSNPEVDIGLALLAMEQSRWKAAEDHLLRALTFRYRDARIHAALGDVYRAQGKWDQAEEAYKKALSIDASHQGARQGLRALELERRSAQEPSQEILRIEDPITRLHSGRFVVEGLVTNVSATETARFVTVVGQFYDRDQRLLAEVQTQTEPPEIPPGQKARWKLSVAYSPRLSGQFSLGVKAVIEGPEAEAFSAEARKEPRFFGGETEGRDDVLKVSIPTRATVEGRPILKGFVINVSDRPVEAIDLLIRLVDRATGRIHSQKFAHLERSRLEPGQRTDYRVELEPGLDLERLRPTMAVSWAETMEQVEPAPREPPEPESARQPRRPTPLPEPLPTRPRPKSP